MLPTITKTPPSGGSPATQQALTANPFTKASRRIDEPFVDVSRALSASAQTLQQIDVPATGYLRSLWIFVTLSGTTGATYAADAPWSVLEQVQLSDVNGQSLVQLSGYNLYLANKFGGYAFYGNPDASPTFSSSGTGATFALRVPIEIIQRNALGSLANLNASMTYKLKLTLAPIASVYATNGTGATIRVQGVVESWINPPAADLNGVPNTTVPPQLGTTQNWSEYTTPTNVGMNTLRLPRVGNTIRNLIFVNRNSSGVRTDAGIPSEIAFLQDGVQVKRNLFTYEQQRIFELWGYDSSERPAGVWVFAYNDDFDGTPGDELGDYWLQTSGATRLELQGNFTAAGSLQIITNDILAWSAPTGGQGQTLGA